MSGEIKKVSDEAEWLTELFDKLVQDHEDAIEKAKSEKRQIPPAANFYREVAREKFRRVYGQSDDTPD